MCMETGRTVILLNLENLYESLYDALNQVSCIISDLGTHKVLPRCLNQTIEQVWRGFILSHSLHNKLKIFFKTCESGIL